MKLRLLVALALCLLFNETRAQSVIHRIFLVGTVYGKDKKPVSGARARLTKNGASAVTKTNGRYRIFRPDSPDILIIAAEGYIQKRIPIDRNTPRLMELFLEEEKTKQRHRPVIIRQQD